MIRFLLRLLGFLILAGGFVALVIDGTRSIAAGAISFTAAATTWAAVSPQTLEKTQSVLTDSAPAVAKAFAAVTAEPTFVVLGVVGILLMLLGRRRRRLVGVVP